MDWGIRAGDTDVTIYMRLRDSTTGLAKTGLVYNSAGAVLSYTLPRAARAAITLATQTVTGAHADGGFVEVDATNCKGLYRVDLSDAAVASGDYTIISIEFDGVIEESIMIPLHSPDVNVTQWLGTAAATPTVAGVPEVDLTHVAGATTNVAALATNVDAILTDTGTTLDGKIDTIAADVVNIDGAAMRGTDSAATAAKLLAYVQLLARSDAAIETDNATELTAINANGGSGAGDYSAQTDAVEALRDRGDAAWTTGGGGSITDLLNVVPLIPLSLDLANTADVRLGLMLTNALDDLPSTAEITPGTVSIDRKAIGGTSWTSVVSDAAMLEIAGLVYYDEVFDAGTGYAEGDSIRVTFKSVKITVAANDYEVVGATGRMFYTEIRQTMRGTNSAALASVCTEGRLAELDAANLPTDVAAVKTDTGNLVARVTSTLFAGITSLAEWLGLMAGKQAGNATALTELKATGAGSGTYNETTDSQEALRDRGDAAWATATSVTVSDKTGFSLAADQSAVTVGAVSGAVGSVTGSVGSVTGAVGSVAGAVGSVTGNVGGSVASVTGAVGSVTGNVGGSVASVTGAVGSVTGNVGGTVAGLGAQAKLDVNAECDTALTDYGASTHSAADVAAAFKVFRIAPAYNVADAFVLRCWLETGAGTIVNVTTVGDIDIKDYDGTVVLDDSAGDWNTAPTEGVDNKIYASVTDASAMLTAGMSYTVEATLDSVAYSAAFTMSA